MSQKQSSVFSADMRIPIRILLILREDKFLEHMTFTKEPKEGHTNACMWVLIPWLKKQL
jgi:hypothetical protein